MRIGAGFLRSRPWSGADEFEFQVEVGDGLEEPGDEAAKGHEDIGVVFLHLVEVGGRVRGFVVEAGAGGEVGPEAVAGEEDLLLFEQGHHGVRPVEHGGFEEEEVAAAEFDFPAGLDHLKGPFFLVVAAEAGLAHGGAEELFRLDCGHGLGQAAGMVHLDVVGDDVVDLLRGDDLGNAGQHLREEFLFDGVDQGDLVVEDEEGVVGGAFFGDVAVEFADIPVDGADPVDVGGELYGHGDLQGSVASGQWPVRALAKLELCRQVGSQAGAWEPEASNQLSAFSGQPKAVAEISVSR